MEYYERLLNNAHKQTENNAKTNRKQGFSKKLSRNHVEDIMRIRINSPDDLGKLSTHKYAKVYLRENHLRTDDPRYRRTTKAELLLEEEQKSKKFLPKLPFL